MRFFKTRPGILKLDSDKIYIGTYSNQQLTLRIFRCPVVHHGIQRIVDDVKENLFDLMRVARNRRHTRLNFAFQVDAAYFHVVVTLHLFSSISTFLTVVEWWRRIATRRLSSLLLSPPFGGRVIPIRPLGASFPQRPTQIAEPMSAARTNSVTASGTWSRYSVVRTSARAPFTSSPKP